MPQRLVVPLQAAHHQSTLKRRHDQRGYRLRINPGSCLAVFPGLLHDDLQATQPGSKSFGDPRPKDGIAIIGVDCGVQDWTSACNRGPVLHEVRDKLLELFDTVCFLIHMQEAGVPGGLPRVIERLRGKLLFAREVPVDSALF